MSQKMKRPFIYVSTAKVYNFTDAPRWLNYKKTYRYAVCFFLLNVALILQVANM